MGTLEKFICLIFLAVTTISSAQSDQYPHTGDYPPDAALLDYSQSILVSGYSGPFDPVSRKINIVWIGDEVDVNKTLRSYGGTIVIVANVLKLNQPLDSRVYFRHNVDHFIDSEKGNSVDWQIAPTNPPAVVPPDKRYVDAFNDYYLHCWDCFSDGYMKSDGKTQSSDTYIPERPSGLTPNFDKFWVNPPQETMEGGTLSLGNDSIDETIGRSGDIYIFAHEIDVSSDLNNPHSPEERAECHHSDLSFVPFAIDAAGDRGGRGGAGVSSPCVIGNACADRAYIIGGGYNAAGGDGSDAGNVYIRLINALASKDLIKRLKGVTTVGGGRPGDQIKVQTPSARGAHQPDGTRCSFTEDSYWPLANKGKDGYYDFRDNVDTNAGVKDIADVLNELDSRNDYDYKELATRAETNRSISSLYFKDQLTRYLVASLTKAETAVVTDADERFYLQSANSDGYLLPLLATISPRDLAVGPLTDRQLQLARELSSFKKPSSQLCQGDVSRCDLFGHYLEQTGGLLDIYSNSAFARYSAQATRIDINTSNTLLTNVETKLDSIHRTLFEQFAHERAAEFESTLAHIQASIAAAKQKAQAAQNNGGPLDFIKAVITDLVAGETGISAIISALTTKFNQDDPLEGGDAGLGQDISTVSDAFRRLSDLSKAAPADTTLQALLAQLNTVSADYEHFKRVTEEARDHLLQVEYKDFMDVLDSRMALENKIASDSAQFHDLFRTIVVGYLMDPGKNNADLRNNLTGLITFLNRFPNEEPYFKPIDVSKVCSSSANPCVDIKPSKRWQVAYGVLSIGDSAGELPLYVIAPHKQTISLPMFGAKVTRKVNLEGSPQEFLPRPILTEKIYSLRGWELVPRR